MVVPVRQVAELLGVLQAEDLARVPPVSAAREKQQEPVLVHELVERRQWLLVYKPCVVWLWPPRVPRPEPAQEAP